MNQPNKALEPMRLTPNFSLGPEDFSALWTHGLLLALGRNRNPSQSAFFFFGVLLAYAGGMLERRFSGGFILFRRWPAGDHAYIYVGVGSHLMHDLAVTPDYTHSISWVAVLRMAQVSRAEVFGFTVKKDAPAPEIEGFD